MGKQQQYTVQLPDSSDVSGAIEPYVPAGQLALTGNDALTPYQMASMQQAVATKSGATVAVPQRPLMLSQQRAIDAACTALATVMPLGTQNVTYFACQFAADKLIQAGRAVTKDSLLSIVKSTPSLLRKARDYIKKFGGKKAARRSINSSYTQPLTNAQNHVVYAQPPRTVLPVMSNFGFKQGQVIKGNIVPGAIVHTPQGLKKILSVSKNKMSRKKLGRATVSAPVARSKRVTSGPPRILKKGRGLTIAHSEMIGVIASAAAGGTFKCDSFINNPGRFATYPWLSSIAGNFDKYILRKCVINFISNQPTSTAGRVGLGIDYDSTDPPPADRNEFFALTHHAEGAPWDSISLNIPLDNKERFVNSHTLNDSKLIDCGQLLFMSDQIANGGVILGDITIDYVVELLQPQQAIYTTQSYSIDSLGSVTTAKDFSVTGPLVAPLTASSANSSTTTMEVSCPQGYYLVSAELRDASAATDTLSITVHDAEIARGEGFGNTTEHVVISIFKFLKPGTIKITLANAIWNGIDAMRVTFTRIPAVVFEKSWGVSSHNLTTY